MSCADTFSKKIVIFVDMLEEKGEFVDMSEKIDEFIDQRKMVSLPKQIIHQFFSEICRCWKTKKWS